MVKVTVEIELDNEAYREKYGPGSEHWKKYMVDYVREGEVSTVVAKPDSEYKSMEGQMLNDAIIDVLYEGFYDWACDEHGWMKLTIDGKAVRQCCNTVDGDKHKDWCPTVAGPEASEIA